MAFGFFLTFIQRVSKRSDKIERRNYIWIRPFSPYPLRSVIAIFYGEIGHAQCFIRTWLIRWCLRLHYFSHNVIMGVFNINFVKHARSSQSIKNKATTHNVKSTVHVKPWKICLFLNDLVFCLFYLPAWNQLNRQ